MRSIYLLILGLAFSGMQTWAQTPASETVPEGQEAPANASAVSQEETAAPAPAAPTAAPGDPAPSAPSDTGSEVAAVSPASSPTPSSSETPPAPTQAPSAPTAGAASRTLTIEQQEAAMRAQMARIRAPREYRYVPPVVNPLQGTLSRGTHIYLEGSVGVAHADDIASGNVPTPFSTTNAGGRGAVTVSGGETSFSGLGRLSLGGGAGGRVTLGLDSCMTIGDRRRTFDMSLMCGRIAGLSANTFTLDMGMLVPGLHIRVPAGYFNAGVGSPIIFDRTSGVVSVGVGLQTSGEVNIGRFRINGDAEFGPILTGSHERAESVRALGSTATAQVRLATQVAPQFDSGSGFYIHLGLQGAYRMTDRLSIIADLDITHARVVGTATNYNGSHYERAVGGTDVTGGLGARVVLGDLDNGTNAE